jgi:hypothetical protein
VGRSESCVTRINLDINKCIPSTQLKQEKTT